MHYHTDVKSIYAQGKTFLYPVCHFGSCSIKVADCFMHHQSLHTQIRKGLDFRAAQPNLFR
jgi:hypothetical protein